MPDLIVFDKITFDTNAMEKMGNNEKAQIINYLKNYSPENRTVIER